MASFLDKLKKGMGVDTEIKEEPAPKIRKKRQAKTVDFKEEPAIEPPQELKTEFPRSGNEGEDEATLHRLEPVKKIEIEEIDKPSFAEVSEGKKEWFEEPAGQLAIDVFQTERDLIIQTAIAGINPGNLEVTVERDIVAIRGIRQKPDEENGDYFTKECYWGPFVREVIVPVEIDPDRVEAVMQEGILTVRMPKILREKKRTITVKA